MQLFISFLSWPASSGFMDIKHRKKHFNNVPDIHATRCSVYPAQRDSRNDGLFNPSGNELVMQLRFLLRPQAPAIGRMPPNGPGGRLHRVAGG